MEKVGSVMTLDEMKEKMDRHNKMVSDARAGNDPICPKCKKGHIKCKGKYFFYCDSPECDMKLSMDPVRGSADAFLDLKSSSACPRQKNINFIKVL